MITTNQQKFVPYPQTNQQLTLKLNTHESVYIGHFTTKNVPRNKSAY